MSEGVGVVADTIAAMGAVELRVGAVELRLGAIFLTWAVLGAEAGTLGAVVAMLLELAWSGSDHGQLPWGHWCRDS